MARGNRGWTQPERYARPVYDPTSDTEMAWRAAFDAAIEAGGQTPDGVRAGNAAVRELRARVAALQAEAEGLAEPSALRMLTPEVAE